MVSWLGGGGAALWAMFLHTILLHLDSLAVAELLPLAVPAFNKNFTPSSVNESHGGHLFSHFKETYDRRVFGQMTIHLLDVSPSSLRVGWRLTNRTFADSSLEVSVICETFDGRMVSNKLQPATDAFEFRFLRSDTEFTVCVYMLEKSPSTDDRVLHFECAPFRTIPVLRPDSVLGVALTLGYLVLMGGMGYVAWWRRSQAIKRRLADADEDDDTAPIKPDRDGSEEDGDGYWPENINATTELLSDKPPRPGCSRISSKDASSSEPALNGSSSYKTKGSSLGSLGALCSRSQKEQHAILYNAKDREISF